MVQAIKKIDTGAGDQADNMENAEFVDMSLMSLPAYLERFKGTTLFYKIIDRITASHLPFSLKKEAMKLGIIQAK